MKTRFRMFTIAAMLAAVATVTTAVGATAGVAPQGLARGATTVTLDQGTIAYVVGLGLAPAAVSPGVLGSDGDDLKASFPIVGNSKDGVIKHTGGLSFSSETVMLTLTNYAIDTNAGQLIASAAVNGVSVGRLPLFDLGSAPKSSDCAATASLALSQDAATALTMVFGAPNLKGADFGDACVAPRS